MKPIPGQVFTATFPFVRCTFGDPEADFASTPSWKPGVEREFVGYEGETESIAHGEGSIVLTVVDVHKPGRYPARVFFTRRWVRPDGQEFGKTALRITTVPAFMRMSRGWRGEEYEVRDQAPVGEED